MLQSDIYSAVYSIGNLLMPMCVCRYVVIAMEALDQLLMACHSQSIKPFVESFLHMVAKLLESREPDLQVLGTNSVSVCVTELIKGCSRKSQQQAG